MKKILFCTILGLITALPFNLSAQYDDEVQDSVIVLNRSKPDRRMREKKEFKMDNFFVGSGLSLNFWGNQFRFDMLPYFGYRIGDAIAPAVGMDYTYYYEFSTQSVMNIWGPKAILRLRPLKQFRPLQGLYLYGEYAYLFVDAKAGSSTLRTVQPRENVGLGWSTNFEKGFGITYELLFDLYWLRHGSIFYPLTYRIGVYYGF